MFDPDYYESLGLGPIHRKVLAGERLSVEDGEALFACPDVLAVGALAHHARTRLHGASAYFVRNRHINYSNVCVTRCRFCAFRREEGEPGAFTLSREEILQKVLDDGGHPFAEIHVVGGCHPTLRLAWFEEVFREIKRLRPKAVLKAFTVVEIAHFAKMEGCATADVLRRLKEAGLAMLTGGGAEIFNPEVRARICPEKIPGSEYLRIAGEAHGIGLFSNCSMLFGHVETHRDRALHLDALRRQQDKSGGFVCFIPLAFQPRHNALAEEIEKGRSPAVDAGLDRLRLIAVARLMLDNIPHIKAYWVMLGVKLAQMALSFGADDLDGTIEEEHIGHMAGADSSQSLTRRELEEMIAGCGFIPVNRDALFNAVGEASEKASHPSSPLSLDVLADKGPGNGSVCRQTRKASFCEEGPDASAPPPGQKRGLTRHHGEPRRGQSRDALAGEGPAVRDIVQRLEPAYARLAEIAARRGPEAHGASRDVAKEAHGASRGIPEEMRPILREARLTPEDARVLYHEAGLYTLGRLAHAFRLALHPEGMVTYVADRNINYSNICVCGCRFCAFFRPPGHAEGYVLGRDELDRKIRETIALGGTQILMQGGHHPDLPLEFYEDMIAWIRSAHPSIHIHAFSPPEIAFFAETYGLEEDEIIRRLVRAGLHSIPGGGAEILVNEVRKRVSPNKCSADAWLGVMRKAHRQGLRTTATMMFGHEETDEDRLAHLFAVRDLQDETGGFTAFIPWTFQPANTNISRSPETSPAYLRVLALSRLVLDCVPNIQASWVTMGPQVAQLALFFGANDFGSLMIEENVVAAAGVSFRLSRREIGHIIERAGFTPRQRYMDYSLAE